MDDLGAPLAIDLFCGLGGWCSGFLAEGYTVVGFDIEARPYPGLLVLQDVRTIHGSQFRNAACLVASPPCTEYSYMAMPWSRAKQIARALRFKGEVREDYYKFPEEYTGSRTLAELNALFDACFRIQREASEAAGRYLPLVVENVKGAQPWVGKARANYGSFYLWGDVDSIGGRIVKRGDVRWGVPSVRAAARSAVKVPGLANGMFPGGGLAQGALNNAALKVPGFNFHEHEKTGQPGRSFQSAAVANGTKGFTTGLGRGHDWRQDPSGRFNSKSDSRKAASAQIAKIPFALANYIAKIYKPTLEFSNEAIVNSDGREVRSSNCAGGGTPGIRQSPSI